MRKCEKCNNEFPNWVFIDGKHRSLSSRKYCLDCSPFGKHNTRTITKALNENEFYCSSCGSTHESEFYGKRRNKCSKCFNKEVHDIGKEKRKYAINKLGGQCFACGYKKFHCSLDVHHQDPKNKDKNFAYMRYWSYERLDKELNGCVLLCRNCHQAYHNGYDIYDGL